MNMMENILKNMWGQMYDPNDISPQPDDEELYGSLINNVARNTNVHPALVAGIRVNIEAVTGRTITNVTILSGHVAERVPRLSTQERRALIIKHLATDTAIPAAVIKNHQYG